MPQIADTAIIHANVALADDAIVEDFCIVGAPARGCSPGEHPTVIGPGAHIRSHTVIYAGNTIGARFQTGNKANIREHNTIGDDVSIGTLSVVEHHVTIGDGVRIHTQVFIPEYTVLEAGCWIGPQAAFTNAKYPNAPGAKASLTPAVVRTGAIIGANVTLLPGVDVGAGALIGAGSVLTTDAGAGGVYAGAPARRIKEITELPYGKEPGKKHS